MDKNSIILIGTSGVGKTTLAKIISEKLNLEYFDIDQIIHDKLKIEKKENYSKEEFIIKKNEEIKVFKNLIYKKEKIIISTNEGLFINQEKENLIKINQMIKNYKNIILILPFLDNTLSKKNLMKRYNLKNITLKQSNDYDNSIYIFKKFAKIIIETKNLNEEQSAQKIIEIIENN